MQAGQGTLTAQGKRNLSRVGQQITGVFADLVGGGDGKIADIGRYGEVVPSRPYKRNAMDCRDYTHKAYIDGRPQAMRGTACRNPDGTWSSVS